MTSSLGILEQTCSFGFLETSTGLQDLLDKIGTTLLSKSIMVLEVYLCGTAKEEIP